MQIELKYFGPLTEITRCDSESIDLEGSTVEHLLEHLEEKYPGLLERKFRVAQKQEFVGNEAPLSGDEIALLPPFSGG
ncbi:MAG: MoaD/ThiS family protein [Bacteroidota bacterium]|nr:MoaD/ThiS family protein [Bacteroidota bacterium]MDX5427359.1 MoaD/ThiS family protein [Bacteroidota bacterium]MDX5447863.1 MoaD/ThiS family protein [Bacteroidota bacterium]MDX5505307.1 MoaD/ThiS family protein [Bacteroidota bacterium]